MDTERSIEQKWGRVPQTIRPAHKKAALEGLKFQKPDEYGIMKAKPKLPQRKETNAGHNPPLAA